MAEKFACKQCGFIFEDPDMEICPQCGTELGQEWNPDDLVDVLVTDLAGSNVPDLIRVIAKISGYPTQKIGPMLQKLPAVVYSGATPMQAEHYLEEIRATNAAAMAESAHDKSSRLTAEANAAGAAATAATEQARLSAAERQAKLDAEMKLKAEKAAAAARAKAEAEAKKAEERMRLEAEARAKAEAEAAKAKAEAEAKKAEEARLQAEAKAKAEAEAKLKAEAEAKAAEEKAKAEAEARAKAEAEAAKAQAEAEAKKAEIDAQLAAEKAKAEAEALANAEIEKKRLELSAEEKARQDAINAKAKKRNTILTVIGVIVFLIIAGIVGLCYVGYLEEQHRKEEAARKQAAIEQEKRDAERRAKEEAERKAEQERQRLENERKMAEAKLKAEAAAKQKAAQVATKIQKCIKDFFNTRGSAKCFLPSLRKKDAFENGKLQGDEFNWNQMKSFSVLGKAVKNKKLYYAVSVTLKNGRHAYYQFEFTLLGTNPYISELVSFKPNDLDDTSFESSVLDMDIGLFAPGGTVYFKRKQKE